VRGRRALFFVFKNAYGNTGETTTKGCFSCYSYLHNKGGSAEVQQCAEEAEEKHWLAKEETRKAERATEEAKKDKYVSVCVCWVRVGREGK
jgi:hypothetical protein